MDNLTDPLDIAAARTQQEIEAALAAHREKPRATIYPTGRCYNCDAELTEGPLFCDDDCNADYVEGQRKREHLANINGGMTYATYTN